MQKHKVTKKERKSLRNNAMVLDCMRNGDKITVGDRNYCGANPEYSEVEHPLTLQKFHVKSHKGIPFVRVK